METLFYLVRRNCKVYFKDKGAFFTSLITPMILLVLFATFLAKTYHDSLISVMPEGVEVAEELINAVVNGQLLSSLLATSCVTVAFSVNLIMVRDKAEDIRRDFMVSPVRPATLALSYFLSSLIATLIVCFAAMGIGFIYVAVNGWYFELSDAFKIVGSVFLLSLFGTAFASVVNCKLKTDGQASAVTAIVSSVYGFICGAYMPLASFSEGLRNLLCFLPGTYGTSVVRNAYLAGPFREMARQGLPAEVINGVRDGIDCNLYLFGHEISMPMMILIVIAAIILMIMLYVFLSRTRKRR